MKWLAAVISISASAAAAQVAAIATPEDSRIAVLQYLAGQTATLQAVPGTDFILLLPRGEHIQSVAIGDTGSWNVVVHGAQDGLTLHALHPVSSTGLSVRTEAHAYAFTLSATEVANVPYIVRVENADPFVAGASPPNASISPATIQSGRYSLSGNKELRPSAIGDDGAKTRIEWSPNQAMPAVFALDGLGREEMVNGYMRDGAFIIDRVYDTLVFRIDKAETRARRFLPKATAQ